MRNSLYFMPKPCGKGEVEVQDYGSTDAVSIEGDMMSTGGADATLCMDHLRQGAAISVWNAFRSPSVKSVCFLVSMLVLRGPATIGRLQWRQQTALPTGVLSRMLTIFRTRSKPR